MAISISSWMEEWLPKSIIAYDQLAQVGKQNIQLACVFISVVQWKRTAGNPHGFPFSPRLL